MTKPDLPTIASELYKLLEPHEPDVRDRAIKAAMVMLGGNLQVNALNERVSPEVPDEDQDGPPLAAKVKSWMRAHGITHDQLGHVFHLVGGASEVLPSESPGKNGKEKTINAYVLAGVAAFLQTGEARFDDRTARDVCKAMGCFNEGNHAYYLKGRGNVIGGTKDAGWMLTGPGLKLGAELIKNLAGEKAA
jgi:hypothetical protein